LLGTDPAGGLLGLLVLADAEELPQQEVLGVHRHVRLELALPPALLVLLGPEEPDGGVECRVQAA
jgi:hypothetical protein